MAASKHALKKISPTRRRDMDSFYTRNQRAPKLFSVQQRVQALRERIFVVVDRR
jgi:hypothetical protein